MTFHVWHFYGLTLGFHQHHISWHSYAFVMMIFQGDLTGNPADLPRKWPPSNSPISWRSTKKYDPHLWQEKCRKRLTHITVPQTNIDPAKSREGRPVLYSRNCLFSSARRVFFNGMFTLKMTHLQLISHDLPIGHYRFSWFSQTGRWHIPYL